jgi:acyl-CoA reductase-like NAD-dependent aldehyde dehydrogenase
MPVVMVHNNMAKIRHVLEHVDKIVAGLTRGLDPTALDSGWAVDPGGRLVSYRREGSVLGAVLPNNSPGVHGLWIPALALKAALALKPGRREPWTPLRVASALLAAGCPPGALGVYPGSHDLAGELLRRTDRAMLFGDGPTVAPWRNDPRVELHGPGWSKVWIGEDAIDEWPALLDVLVASIASNGGRSCLAASGVWVPREGRAIAQALAERLITIPARGLDDPQAALAAFADEATARAFDSWLEAKLAEGGAEDVTARLRRGPRLVQVDGCWFLLPTIVFCDSPEHPLAQAELLFPFAAVVETPQSTVPAALGSTLVLSAITKDRALAARLLASPQVDRLNLGPISTMAISWDQPHEGNLFELLWRRRSLQGQGEVLAR